MFYIVADEPTVDLTMDIRGCEQSCTLEEFSKRSEIYKIDNRIEVNHLNLINNNELVFSIATPSPETIKLGRLHKILIILTML